ncbi:hypothetical protein [uncultured Agrobacterium sp.]|uniref:hypothetical protein n=1 Tax=uncultured Agrobacterium sp. TaxID=157277 RepID=UPI00258A9D2E|nr:hypothetical protein [uncultured Agrobacterium sp.]
MTNSVTHTPTYPTYIITQEAGMVPRRKGPFFGNKMVEDFLRDAYRYDPAIICIVIDMESEDNTWYPEHGYEWLDINSDRRKRHPRKDRPKQTNAPPSNMSAPKGYVLVPIKPTKEMAHEAACHFYGKNAVAQAGGIHGMAMQARGGDPDFWMAFKKLWKAALAHAPQPSEPAPPQTRAKGIADLQHHMAEPRAERCVACDEVLQDGDSVYCEISEGGHIHAWCATDDPKSYVDEDEQPIKEGDALPEPFPYKSEHQS